jgi:hypothetical protein
MGGAVRQQLLNCSMTPLVCSACCGLWTITGLKAAMERERVAAVDG